jgi:transketolase
MALAYQSKTPGYLRMGKSDRGDVHNADLLVTAGHLLPASSGATSDINFIATGSLLRTTVDIAREFYPSAEVWSAPFIKPINVHQVSEICKRSSAIVVLEEHSVLGGLGSVITEIACEFAPVRILRIGVQDRFSQHCGTYEYLLREHGLDRMTIVQRIHEFLSAE